MDNLQLLRSKHSIDPNMSCLLENIIVAIAKDKHDKRIKCHCEENDYKTIIVSIDEIREKCINNNINYNDIEYLLCDEYNKSYFNCCPSYEILILKYLKKRIKYDKLSRYYRRVKTVYISNTNGFYIVFELKSHKN